jgi:hypothetical protein
MRLPKLTRDSRNTPRKKEWDRVQEKGEWWREGVCMVERIVDGFVRKMIGTMRIVT